MASVCSWRLGTKPGVEKPYTWGGGLLGRFPKSISYNDLKSVGVLGIGCRIFRHQSSWGGRATDRPRGTTVGRPAAKPLRLRPGCPCEEMMWAIEDLAACSADRATDDPREEIDRARR